MCHSRGVRRECDHAHAREDLAWRRRDAGPLLVRAIGHSASDRHSFAYGHAVSDVDSFAAGDSLRPLGHDDAVGQPKVPPVSCPVCVASPTCRCWGTWII